MCHDNACTRRSELAITIIVILLSGASVSFLILGSLDIVSYGIFRDIAVIPSVIAVFAIGIFARKKFQRLSNRLFVGMAAGAIATLALEIFRVPGYLIVGWIPMDDMIMLPGMLLAGKAETIMGVREIVMQSGTPMNLFIPPLDALAAGALWHFWNGATFGIVYSLFIGRGKWWYGLVWGFVVEVGMMLAPWLIMMKGPFGLQYMDGYNVFVMTLIAHLAFGSVLGILVQKWKKHDKSIFELKKITEVKAG